MAEIDIAPSFGAELKDGFKPVDAWVSNGIQWIDDFQQFYRERAAIEKDYSAKLTALAKKYYEKKARKSSNISVGDTPTLTPGSLESASMTTWTTQLQTLETRAGEHDRYANDLVNQVAGPLQYYAGKFEELRKNHADYAAKLQKERDASYGDLKKIKSRYDGVCQEVENRRKKHDSAFDHGKNKAQTAYQQQVMEMRNTKNTYLIAINVTNKLKENYYHEYVPELLDSLQDLNETRVTKVNALWTLAAQLETGTMTRSADALRHLTSEIPRNDPRLDSMMFVRHNASNWQDPPDMGFEPSPVWLDDASMCVDDNSKVFLRNTLSKSKSQARELKQEADKKRREVENAKKVRQMIREGKDKRDEAEAVRAIFALQEDMHQTERKRLTAEVETSLITSVVGDLSVGAKNHNFRSQTFKIPTNCDLCGDRIWGLSAKGYDCADCGYTCHSKCELRVPAECPGELSREEKKKIKIERQAAATSAPAFDGTNGATAEMPTLQRQDTMNSLSSGYATSAHRSVSGAVPTQGTIQETIPELPASTPTPASAPASKPPAARKNRVVAPPPTAYVSTPTSNGPTGGLAGLGGASKSNEAKGKMVYGYQANDSGEITVAEGREVTILEPDDGSGWVKVRAGAMEGLVPASYVDAQPLATPTLSDRPGSTYSSASSLGGTAPSGKKQGPAVAPRRGAKKLKHVEALYDYAARSDAEWDMAEGDRFVLVNLDGGDGWADVERNGQTRSVPAAYIQEV